MSEDRDAGDVIDKLWEERQKKQEEVTK